MREELADIVYPVISYGLRLRQRLARGERPSLAAEQQRLKAMLRTEDEARRWPDYGSEVPIKQRGGFEQFGNTPERAVNQAFFGVRYALACWLDELFLASDCEQWWRHEWNEHKLEDSLFQIELRAEKFWVQSRLAEEKAGPDALEAFFLLTMLGFRGDKRMDYGRSDEERGQPKFAGVKHSEELDKLVQRWEKRAVQNLRAQFEMADRGRPPCNVPPLVGRDKFQRMFLVAAILLLLIVPAAAILLVHYLLSS